MLQVAKRTDITRKTLYIIELGNSSLVMDSYFNVLGVLVLQNDL